MNLPEVSADLAPGTSFFKVDDVGEVVDAARKKTACKQGGHNAFGSKNQGRCIKAEYHPH